MNYTSLKMKTLPVIIYVILFMRIRHSISISAS